MKKVLSLFLIALLAFSAAGAVFADSSYAYARTQGDGGGLCAEGPEPGGQAFGAASSVLFGSPAPAKAEYAAAAFAGAAQNPSFPDVPQDAWYRGYVEDAKNRNIVEGYDDGYFRPLKTVTYGEFITMAVRHGMEKSDGRWDHWAYPHYLKAVKLGYFTESQISYRKLSKEIPRKDMALIISGMLDAEDLSPEHAYAVYSDVTKAHPYEFYISSCSSAGILEGYDDGSFRPDGYLKRSEAAKVFSVFAGLVDEAAENAAKDENAGGKAPSSAKEEIPPERRKILESVLESISCYRENGKLYVAYDQPEIPDKYRMNLQFWVYGTEAENRSQLCWFCSDYSGADYQEKYDPSAHRLVREVKGLTSVSGRLFRITVKVWNSDSKYSYSLIQIDKERDGSVNLYYKNCEGEKVSGEYIECPKGLITW